jgi:hypothetical protein
MEPLLLITAHKMIPAPNKAETAPLALDWADASVPHQLLPVSINVSINAFVLQ